MTLRSAMNFPSSETKKPWPFALKCPVSSNTETMTTAPRTGCATSTKTLVGACDRCGEGVVLDSTGAGVADVAGVGAAERGEGSGARTIEALRSHETSVHRTRMKQTPLPLIVLTTSRAGRRLKDKIKVGGLAGDGPALQLIVRATQTQAPLSELSIVAPSSSFAARPLEQAPRKPRAH